MSIRVGSNYTNDFYCAYQRYIKGRKITIFFLTNFLYTPPIPTASRHRNTFIVCKATYNIVDLVYIYIYIFFPVRTVARLWLLCPNRLVTLSIEANKSFSLSSLVRFKNIYATRRLFVLILTIIIIQWTIYVGRRMTVKIFLADF